MNRNDADGPAPVGHGAWRPWHQQHPWQAFRRTDEDIAADVRRLLDGLLLDRRSAVSVSAADGIVTLTGTVPTEEINLAVAQLAADISGVVEVVSRLTTGPVLPDRTALAPFDTLSTHGAGPKAVPSRRGGPRSA